MDKSGQSLNTTRSQQHRHRILNVRAESCQPLRAQCTVDNAVITRQCGTHDGSFTEAASWQSYHPLLCGSHCQDCNLRKYKNRIACKAVLWRKATL